ncbi:Ig-like domain-containing protein [Alloalcanivorax xenomutans]|uniref:Ig-like domain-containing protein n=1 Tax=Alloalcanivorax xenomutans TaxID=1094342 RepID=UPI003BA977CA
MADQIISIIDKSSGAVTETPWSDIVSLMGGGNVVQMPLSPEQIDFTSRVGNDLVITLKNGEQVTISNFYPANEGEEAANELQLLDDEGVLWLGQSDGAGGIGFAQAASGGGDWGLAALAVGGAAAAFLISDSSSGSSSGGSGGDNVAPDAPTDLAVSGDGSVVTGRGEPGSTVTVRDSDGNVIGEGQTNAEGDFEVELSEPQVDGEELDVSLTDEAGNESEPGQVTAPDSTAPDAPTNVEVSGDGTTVTGEGEPGSKVTITDPDGNVIGEGTVDDDGNFTVELTEPQTDGEELEVTLTDGAGNESEPVTAVAPDGSGPDAPVITQAEDDVAPGTGPLMSGGSTNDTTPTLTGTAEAGSTVTIFQDGTEIGSTTADASGNWSFAPTALADGDYSFTATATDEANNVSDPSPAFDLTVDTAAPQVTVEPSDGSVLAGTAEAGSTVEVDTNGDGTPDYTVEADADGNWSVAPDAPLAHETEVSVTATDAAGNTSDPVTTIVDENLNDTTPPAAPTIAEVVDDVAPGTDPVLTGGSTNDTTPTLTGTAEAGSTVAIFQDGTEIGTATADGSGNWSFTPATELAEGDYSFTATATDAAGNTSDPSTAFELNVDTTAPAAPTVDPTDGTTLTGTAEAGSTVDVDVDGDGTPDYTVEADGDGNWSVTPDAPLADGTEVSVTASDPAGNTSDPVTTIVDENLNDTTPPVVTLDAVVTNDSTPELTGTVDDPDASIVVSVGGNDYVATNNGNGTWTLADGDLPALTDGDYTVTVTGSDGAGNEGTATGTVTIDTVAPEVTVEPSDGALLTGTAEAGSTVEVDINGDGTPDYTVEADADGNWSVAPDAPLAHETEVSVTATDEAGNTSDPVTTIVDENLNDTTPPAAPTIAEAVDDVAPGTDPVLTGGSTNDTTPTLSGTAEAGSTVAIFQDGTEIGTATADGSGNWSFTPATELAEGDYSFTATATDAAGNTSDPSTAFEVTVDTTAPAAPTVEPTDGTILTGTAEAGSTVQVDTNGDGTPDYTVEADADGNWSVTPDAPLADGTEVSVTATDEAGNTSDPVTTTVDENLNDTTPPAAPTIAEVVDDVAPGTDPVLTGGSTNDTTPTLTGTAEAGSTVAIFQDGTEIGTTTADGSGNWSFTPTTELAEGDYSFTATATDAAGNTSDPSTAFEVTVDTTAPAAPTVEPTDGTTLTGTAEAGSTVDVDVDGDGTPDYTVEADADGNWSVAPDAPLAHETEVSVTATDEAGNTSDPVTTIVDENLNDTTPPVVTLDAVVTNDSTPELTGTVDDPDASIVVSVGGNDYVATNNGNGTWTLADGDLPALTDGDYTVTVTGSDGAGNEGTATGTVTIDTVAPEVTVEPSDGALLTGTAEAGSTVEVDINGDGTPDYTVEADADGNWSVAPDAPLAHETEVSVTATDEAGNTSDPVTTTVDENLNDTTPPAAPTIAEVVDDVAPGTDPVLTGGSTNDTTPTLSGTAEAGSTVAIFQDGTEIGTTTADGSGNWSFTPSTELAEGDYSFTATATDAAGNTSDPSTAFEVTVDTTAPAAPTVEPTDGTILTGTAEAGSTVEVDTNGDGTPDYTVETDADGNWSVTPDAPLADGTEVSVTATDPAGNTSDPATTIVDENLNDTTPPAAPTIAEVVDDVAPGTDPVLTGGSTNDTTPTLTGTAEAGSTVEVFQDGVSLGTVTADGSGNWSFTPTTELAEGDYSFTATATDAAGNTSDPSTAFEVTVDTTAPEAPTVEPTDGTVLAGTAEAGSTVEVDTNGDGTPDYTVEADADGNWSVTPDAPLADGTDVSVTARDPAGNTSDPVTVTVDATAPEAPAITEAQDDVEPGTDPILSGGSTNDTTPTLAGTAEAGSTVEVFQDGVSLGTVEADADGNWSFTPSTELGEGSYSFTATATDAAGNTSDPSTAFEVTVDTTAPEAPVVNPSDGTELSGTAEPGSTVGVDVDGDGTPDYTVEADADGNWSVTPDAPLADGAEITVTASDEAGNTSDPVTAIVDAAAPEAPVITQAEDDVAPGTDPVLTGGSTNDTTPTLSGTAEAGSTVAIFQDGTEIGTTTADGSGNWSFTPSTELAEGDYSFTATATDAAGNTSDPSTAFELNVDTTAPAAPTVEPTDGTILTGTAEAGSTVQVDTNGDGTPDYTVEADADGNWSVTPDTPLADGTEVSVTATDGAGNASAPATINVDASAPATPTIQDALDDVDPGTDPVLTGGSTNDDTPTLRGTAEANSTVEIFQDGASVGTVQADASGNWSFVVPAALADGTYGFTATAMDEAGNTSDPSAAFDVTVDTVAPDAPTLSVTDAADGIIDSNEMVDGVQTEVGLPAGTEAGDVITLTFTGDGGAVYTAEHTVTADEVTAGTANVDVAQWLDDGTYTATATITDAAGNVSPDSNSVGFDVDASGPVVNVAGGSLLGLVGVEAIGLLDLNHQMFSAYDPNNNLASVTIEMSSLLSVNQILGLLGAGNQTLNWSQALADELGLDIQFNDYSLLPPNLTPTLTITAVDGGAIDNLAINEFLASIYLADALLGTDVGLLPSYTITGEDVDGQTATDSVTELAELSLLNAANNPVTDGTSGADTLEGSAGDDRLYGYDGDDVLNGNAGDDWLRGGSGNDTLNGGDGSDTLVYEGLGNDTFDGGAGEDTLLLTGDGISLDFVDSLAADYVDPATINNIEHLSIGGTGANTVSIDLASLIAMTDTDNVLFIDGDQDDTVELVGEWQNAGTTTVDGTDYVVYSQEGDPSELWVQSGISVI